MDDKLHFTVDARLVTQLGEQLVPSDVMALAELAKNAYDADAAIALIDYYPNSKSNSDLPCLIIEDDGSGMTADELRHGWMTIGTSLKESTPDSPRFWRPRAGRKGIGRFAAQRLGRELTLWTTTKGTDYALEIDIKWDLFDTGGALEDVGHTVRTTSADHNTHGTRLVIQKLCREWSREDFEKVLKDLISIQAPSEVGQEMSHQVNGDPGFTVLPSYHGDRIEVIDERDLLLDERVMSVEGIVNENGKGTYHFEFYRPLHPALDDTYRDLLTTGPLRFSIDLFIFNRANLERLGIRQAQSLGRRYGGVRIWRDGFRVFPYGDPEDDWLGLDAHVGARRPPLNMWRNQQVLGGVHITRARNPQFEDLLTRRGVVETEAFRSFQKFVFEGLKIAANEHASITGRQSRGGPAQSKPSEEVRRQIEVVRMEREIERQARREKLQHAESVQKVSEEERQRRESEELQTEEEQRRLEERLVKIVEESEKDLLDYIAMLRVLASLGTGLAAFSHELRMVMQPIGLAAQELEQLTMQLPKKVAESFQSQIRTLEDGMAAIATYRKYIDEFIRAGSRRRRESIEMAPYMQEFLATFSALLERRKVQVTVDIPRGLRLRPMHRAELHSVVFNLLTNAVKALLAPGVSERKLLFRGYRDGGSVCLVVVDSGGGIPDAIVDRVFEPFVTRSLVDDDTLGSGTGLGLSIVREILDESQGNIEVIAAPPGYQTAFEVRFPAREDG